MRSIAAILGICLCFALNVTAQNNPYSVEWITDKQAIVGTEKKWINTINHAGILYFEGSPMGKKNT